MDRKPRDPNEKLLLTSTLVKSVLQGLAIFGASFGSYYFFLRQNPDNAPLARTMGLAVIMIANLFLVQVNSSNSKFAFRTLAVLSRDKVMWAVNIGTFAGLLLMLYTPLSGFLKLSALSVTQLLLALGIAAASVLWYEAVKWVRLITKNKQGI